MPLTVELATELQGHRQLPAALVFTDANGVRRKHAQVWRMLGRLAKRSGLERIRPHDLRHTFASQLVSSGAPIAAVQQLLGHADIQTTMRYAHLAPGVDRRWVAQLETLGANWEHRESSSSPGANKPRL